MQSFEEFVGGHVALLEDGKSIPLGVYPSPEWTAVKPNAEVVMIFVAHPDDEILSGALAIRCRREGARVVVVAMTLGSKKSKQKRRQKEMEGACAFLGFELVTLNEHDPVHVLKEYKPDIVITHHENDGHPRHKRVNETVRRAMKESGLIMTLIETEYWHALEKPNAIVEIAAEDVVLLLKALSFHKGELERNPYHLSFPALLINNARLCEKVYDFGSKPKPYRFAALYRVSRSDGYVYPYPMRWSVNTGTSVLKSFCLSS